jgi:two-component system, response regulator RegA
MQEPQPEQARLLLVDEDRSFCHGLARALAARGYGVESCHDGSTALKMIDATAPAFAIIELRLPDMSGLRLIEQIRSAAAPTGVVVHTAFAGIATAVAATKRGAIQYLVKPSSVDDIIAAFSGDSLDEDSLSFDKPLSVDRLEWEHIQRILTEMDGNISATARALNMHRRTLQRKLYKHPPGR